MYKICDICELDQVLAQWHANLIGLGEIFDKENVKTALASIYKYNYIEKMRNHTNPCRIYSLNDDGGLIICTWKNGREKASYFWLLDSSWGNVEYSKNSIEINVLNGKLELETLILNSEKSVKAVYVDQIPVNYKSIENGIKFNSTLCTKEKIIVNIV